MPTEAALYYSPYNSELLSHMPKTKADRLSHLQHGYYRKPSDLSPCKKSFLLGNNFS